MTSESLTGKHLADDTRSLKDLMKWSDRDQNGAVNLNE
jgi:hypothetical protein